MTHPNIIFLSVDAMRFDHTGLGDYARPTTPTLNRMRDNAVFCPNAFSLAPFTQSACIQMLTSTRPFSFGGYDQELGVAQILYSNNFKLLAMIRQLFQPFIGLINLWVMVTALMRNVSYLS
jgi:glucan phosphoethanolaminetransferase (alkaline phosphatase superfamily)